MFGIDKGRDASRFLRFGYRMKGKGCLAASLRSENFDDPASRVSPDAKGDIEG